MDKLFEIREKALDVIKSSAT